MPVGVASKILPYLLLAFVGAAGWAMNSVALLAVVVLGTVGVAIGTAVSGRPQVFTDQPEHSEAVRNALEN